MDASEMKPAQLEKVSYECFAKLVRARFRVRVAADDWVELELAEATPQRFAPSGGASRPAYENFSLLFRGPVDRVLPQKIYPFESKQLGQFELFIVPIGQDQSGTKYEATFNRRVADVPQ